MEKTTIAIPSKKKKKAPLDSSVEARIIELNLNPVEARNYRNKEKEKNVI